VTEALLVRWLRLAAERVAAARELLTSLDAAIGDGDHGINLDRGFAEVVRRLDAGELPDAPPAATLELAGRAIMATVGGASGALYGRGLQRAGASLAAPVSPAGPGGRVRVVAPEPVAAAPEPAAAAPEPAAAAPATREEQAAQALAAAVEAITALGRATPGEKTMLDALVPARDAFRSAVSGGADLAAAAAAAAAAADTGAAATIPLLATKGRASYLGERSIGHLDPGAVSSAILLRALADVAAG
jgi:dihydroxyacetone kinase-like protein